MESFFPKEMLVVAEKGINKKMIMITKENKSVLLRIEKHQDGIRKTSEKTIKIFYSSKKKEKEYK